MSKCIVTGAWITPGNDSDAHIIPSALGGRVKPKGILSQEGNRILNAKVDAPLIRALGPFMALLGGSRDRGDNAPVMMEASGTTYLVVFGQPIRLARPEYVERVEGQKTIIEIKARTIKEARQLLGRIKSLHPDFNMDDVLSAAIERSIYLPDKLQVKLNVGPNPLFPAVFAMANVFSASLGMPIHQNFSTYIHALPDRVKFEPEGQVVVVEMPPDTFYWIPQIPLVSRPAGVTHIITYVGDPLRKQALVCVELFNLPTVAVILPYNGSEQWHYSYAIDVVTGLSQIVTPDLPAYSQPWVNTHETSELFDLIQRSVGQIVELAMQRMRDVEVERIVSEVVGTAPVITAQHVEEISNKLAELVSRLMTAQSDLREP